METESKIAEYIESRKKRKLDDFHKKVRGNKKIITSQSQIAEFDLENATKQTEIEVEHIPSNWIDAAAKRSNQIKLATHALKFTHPDAKGTSIYYPGSQSDLDSLNSRYLNTQTLSMPIIDSVGNAAALGVANLLQLKYCGETLASRILRGDNAALRPFSESETQLQEWTKKFQQVIADKELSSHTFAKQIYFPINHNEYHLLGPLYPTSLAQEFYIAITTSRFSESARTAKDAKRKKKYSDILIVDYANVAVQNFGGTKPQNISQLNTARKGESFLFSCAPPVWQKIVHLPHNSESIFKKGYGDSKTVWQQLKELKKYLEDIHDKRSNKNRRDYRAELIDRLIDELFSYASRIQSMSEHSGWSATSALPKAQQLWLDPLRDDNAFQEERRSNNWKNEIADQFADFLNRRVKSDKLILGDNERSEWKSLVLKKLRLLKDDLEDLT